MRKLKVITNSEVKSFRSCPRKHWYAYVLLRRPKARPHALAFGSLAHVALEAWWKGLGNLDAALDALHKPSPDADELDPADLARVEVMIRAYHWMWHAAPYWVIGVEQEFRAPLVHPETGMAHAFDVSGKFDALAHDEAGRVWIVEHKTSGENLSPGSAYFEALKVDTQISTYMMGVRSLGHEPAGVLYDVLGKPRITPLKATPEESRKYVSTGKRKGELYANQRANDETLAEYTDRLGALVAQDTDAWLKRTEVVRLASDEHEAALDLWAWAERIEQAIATASHPRNPDACKSFGRLCEYFGCCTGEADIDDDKLFRTADSHEELSGENQTETWDPEPANELPI